MVEIDNDIVGCLECSAIIKVIDPKVNQTVVCPNCKQEFRVRLGWMLQGVYDND
jgi:uncharacterized paraquat-inducible protein A